jgi:hypothetical protein
VISICNFLQTSSIQRNLGVASGLHAETLEKCGVHLGRKQSGWQSAAFSVRSKKEDEHVRRDGY